MASSKERTPAGLFEAAELARLAQELGTARDLLAVFRALRHYAGAVSGCNALFVSLLDPERRVRHCKYAWADGEEVDVRGLPPLPMSGGPHARAVATGEVIVVEDLQVALANRPNVSLGYERDPRSPNVSVAVPLAVFGRVIGGFEVQIIEHPSPREFVPSLQVAANLAAAAIENVRLLEQERELRRAAELSEQRWRASEERLRLALDSARMGTWDSDLLTSQQAISPAAERLLGLEPGAFVARGGHFEEFVHPEDRELFDRSVREAGDKGIELEIEVRVILPDQTVRWVVLRGSAVNDERGHRGRMAGVLMDVTERKQAEQQRELLARGEKLRALGQMASGIAHDLNQSLALISGYGELVRHELDAGLPDADRLRELFGITIEAAHDGGETVRRLLTFARAQQPSTTQLLDLGVLLTEVAQLTAPRWRDAATAEGRPIRLELDVPAAGEAEIDGSPARLREAFTNLVFNAVDALPEGGTIRLRAYRRDRQIIAEVADSGVGIPPEVQARIFEPFFTTKGDRGTGLGLSQVFGIVEQHHGQVNVESAPGRGTTFRVTVPAAAQRRVPAAEAAPVAAAVRPSLRILAVDDDARLAALAKNMLASQGHKVDAVTSGEAALARLEEAAYDVVVSDLGLGEGITGWDIAQYVRTRSPRVGFILATGWGAEIDPEHAAARGVDAVIAKPYRAADLRQVVEEIAAVHRDPAL
jgi:PAS domain S-box-containing protein